MDDVTVACACGRTMTPDARSGRGAFRCGCGSRITVTVTRAAACTGLAESGEVCRFPPVREAAREGLSLCSGHYQRYQDLLSECRQARETIANLAVIEDDEVKGQLSEDHRRRYAEQSVVYYVRLRDLIKIGTTVNMTARSGDLLWDEVLATEPGDRELEQMRHRQFHHLRVRGERFTAGPDLMSHIAMIREHFGEPQITGYLPFQSPVTPPPPAR